MTIISVLILPVTHKKYHWLEKQEGFPYFNELFDEKKDSTGYENNSPYQKIPDRYGDLPHKEENKNITEYENPYQKIMDKYKNSSGKMDEI